MEMAEIGVPDTGASIVYEPKETEPLVDIVFVHGLQGHPFRTWACDTRESTRKEKPEVPISSGETSHSCPPQKRRWWWWLPNITPEKRQRLRNIALSVESRKALVSTQRTIFWPRDLLPLECPKARVLVLGYDTAVVTLKTRRRTNQNNIFTHSKDLLNELSRIRPSGRRIIFVAHSLGGILVKEMLAICSTSPYNQFEDILNSTAAVVFLGTPHRGSPMVSLGAVARKAASLLLLDTNPRVLDSLALKNADLSRCQDAFSSLWTKQDFQVKSFQEGLALKTAGLPFRVVVPDFSSCLGDPRERAETLHADHRAMCRFSSADCPNYRKVSGELVRLYSQLEDLSRGLHTSRFNYTSFVKAVPDAARILRFPDIQTRLATISSPLDNTCMWLPQAESYANWISRARLDEHHGLLQVTGKPGSGKSTIMKKAYEQVISSSAGTKTCVASFFFNKRGRSLEHSSLGMFRSLLYQILEFHPLKLTALMGVYEDETRVADLHLSRLQDIFRDVFLDQTNDIRTIIFIDALDECDEPENRDTAYFFRQLTVSAHNIGVQLDVCLARRDFPTVSLSDCPEIKIERFTKCDIEHYISEQFNIVGFGESDTMLEIRREIADKANGVFLWVVLVINEIAKQRDNGRNERYLLKQIRHLPAQLDSLFAELLDLRKMSKPELRLALRLFQWAILSTSTLRLREWHHILAFIRAKPPKSLAKWKKSMDYTQIDEQLEKQIRAISRGLVEVKVHPIYAGLSDEDGAGSLGAGAGSLDSASGDSKIVQPIHESVRAFFLEGGKWISEALRAVADPKRGTASFSAEGHITIMKCCFEYLAIEELQQYYEARLRHNQRSKNEKRARRKRRLHL
ncbi:hypothetical protein F5Y10DRAFT_263195 [Nemania abortiva]|nr:hypothetical protein F5Y10DRAFT_263195 [Nemania abortiva]